MRYETKDGKIYTVRTERELVTKMQEDSQQQGESLEEWMANTAHRASMQTACPVDGSTAHTLVRDLLQVGLLKRLED